MIPFKDLSQSDAVRDLYKEEEEELVKMLSDKYGLPYVDLRTLAQEPRGRDGGVMKKKGKNHDAIVKVAIAAAKKGKKPPKKSMVDEDGDVDFTEMASRGKRC